MKKLILLLLCITGSVAAMDLGQSFGFIHLWLTEVFVFKKKISQKTKPNNSKRMYTHKKMADCLQEFIDQNQPYTEPEESTKNESE